MEKKQNKKKTHFTQVKCKEYTIEDHFCVKGIAISCIMKSF